MGFKVDKKAVDGHFYWTRFTKEELEAKKDGVFVDVLPKFVLDLKENPKLINDDNFWKRAMELYSYLIQNSSILLFILYNQRLPGVGPLHHLWGIITIGAVMQNTWLAANDLGISVQIVSGQLMTAKSAKKIKDILNIPDGYKPMLILRLGYEGKYGKYGTKYRKELKDFVHLDHFSNQYK